MLADKITKDGGTLLLYKVMSNLIESSLHYKYEHHNERVKVKTYAENNLSFDAY